MRPIYIFLLLLLGNYAYGQDTPYERSQFKETATYPEVIAYYQMLDSIYTEARLLTYGDTDFGIPLHLFVLSKNGEFDPETIRKDDKRILLINNGIHPGEPEGIDASMMLSRDLLQNDGLPENVVICIIPLYNIGGSFNRSSTSRANQNGPMEYGFRGNRKNYDLNRDFIKTDSKNSASFQEIFNQWQPEVFIDNHTSNGSDYQHVMTLIPTQKDKLQPILSEYLVDQMLPEIYRKMESNGYPLVPYVQTVSETPEEGIIGFFDSPRYSTGYAALHNCIGFMPETHMLKEYELRVDATYKLMQSFISTVDSDAALIGKNKAAADRKVTQQTQFPLTWRLDKTVTDSVIFNGYHGKHKPSTISGFERLYYDRNDPYKKRIPVWNTFRPALSINKPAAYVIPRAWEKVIALLKLNRVNLDTLKRDTLLNVESYYIRDFVTGKEPYEGHYLHSDVKIDSVRQSIKYYAGDILVFTNQVTNRYIVETLEPQGSDSFFSWNFFDSILGQKEHFSSYIFEDTAEEILKQNPELRKKLEERKLNDRKFASDGRAQLEYIYKNSVYYEKTHNRYPIARLIVDE